MPFIPGSQVVRSAGPAGPPGPTGPTGPLAARNSLGATASIGATSITMNASAVVPISVGNVILIDAYTSQAELRKITIVAGTTVSFDNPLRYAHAADDLVLSIESDSLTLAMWDCNASDGTDDWEGFQEAVVQANLYGNNGGMWLNGENRLYYFLNQPLMVGSATKLRNVQTKAMVTFAPIDASNAMVMCWNGNLVEVASADAGTDVITTSSVHGIPANDIAVVFQGSSLPGGIVSGRLYYAKSRPSTTSLTLSETIGGSTVNITSTGTGRCYCEVYGTNAKTMFESCYFVGGYTSTPGLNGLMLSVQQQGYADTLRVDNFDGFGIKLKGQQYVLRNFESILCRTAMVLDDMSFLYCDGFNAEGCDIGISVIANSASNHFYGMHFEMSVGGGTYGTNTSIGFDMTTASCQNLILDGVNIAINGTSSAFFHAAAGKGGSYLIRGVYWAGAGPADVGKLIVNDEERGIALDVWDDCKAFLTELYAPSQPSSAIYPAKQPIVYIGPGGRMIGMGAQNNAEAQMHIRPGTSQTGDEIRAEDTSGNRVSGFNKAGVIFTERNTVPADGDLVAGELTFWFDDTNGAAKLMVKAKQADGTVRTGSVTLS